MTGADASQRRVILASPYLLLALAALFWSGNFVLGRAVSGHVPPIGLAFWRWLGALAILLPVSWRTLRKELPLLWRARRVVVALGIFGIGSFNTLVYLGLRETTATNAVLLNSACPAFIAALSFGIGSARPTTRQLAGIAVSLAGVLAILGRGNPRAILSLTANPGDLWVSAGVLSWAIYTVLLGRLPAGLDRLALLTALVAVGVVWIAPFRVLELARGARMRLDAVTILSVLYLAILPSIVAYAFWNRAVAAIGANRAGVFLHLMPAFGSLLAIALLGESFRGFHVIGILLILAGVSLAGTGISRRPAPPPAIARS